MKRGVFVVESVPFVGLLLQRKTRGKSTFWGSPMLAAVKVAPSAEILVGFLKELGRIYFDTPGRLVLERQMYICLPGDASRGRRDMGQASKLLRSTRQKTHGSVVFQDTCFCPPKEVNSSK